MIIPETIKFNNINKIYALGDIHGLFETAVYDILQLNVKDSIFIACGDIGMGFNKFNYYTTLFDQLNKKLKDNNLILILFRGNHDDPMYFQHKEFRDNQFNNKFEYIKLISDYTILSINDNINILCIGGGRSIDKSYRLIKNYGYWENEDIVSINEVDISLLNNINIVCTHAAPDFCRPKITQQTLDLFDYYVNLGDSTLIQDLEKEGQKMTEIYNQLISTNNVYQWIYGHYHTHTESIYNDIKFIGLDMIRQNISYIRRQRVELDFRALTYTDLYEVGT